MRTNTSGPPAINQRLQPSLWTPFAHRARGPSASAPALLSTNSRLSTLRTNFSRNPARSPGQGGSSAAPHPNMSGTKRNDFGEKWNDISFQTSRRRQLHSHQKLTPANGSLSSLESLRPPAPDTP